MTPRVATYLLAALIAVSFAYDLMRIPVQVSDSLGEILDAQRSSSAFESFVASLSSSAYMRPLRIAQIKALFDLADGRAYWLVYRGFHALLLIAAIMLFTRALDVRTWSDWAAAVFALTVLTGLHIFRDNVRESFPINAFLEMVVCCLIALNIARSRGGWLVDLAAVLTFIAASLTLESGLLVWVVVAAAWVAGMRRISSRGAAAVTAMLALYMVARFAVLDVGTPGLIERDAGFGFTVLDRGTLEARFGDDPTWFYLYNVAASIAGVLFAEPQSGVFLFTRAWMLDDEVLPRVSIAVLSSAITTALIAWAAFHRLRTGRLLAGQSADSFFLIFAAVLAGNAVFSFAYTKDEIITVAGAFYALAAYAAARVILEQIARPASRGLRPMQVILCAVMCAVATLWVVRSVGAHHMLRVEAFKQRNDWGRVPVERLRDAGSPDERQAAALVRRLQQGALEMRVPNPYVQPRWMDRWWGE